LQHAAGLQVWCWTARTATQYRSAIELGVDAVVADDPRSLRTWLASRSPSLPTH
jgi:glycerophosphoryl diester phosphodiesterase